MAAFEIAKRELTGILRFVAVNGSSIDFLFFQQSYNLVGPMLGS